MNYDCFIFFISMYTVYCVLCTVYCVLCTVILFLLLFSANWRFFLWVSLGPKICETLDLKRDSVKTFSTTFLLKTTLPRPTYEQTTTVWQTFLFSQRYLQSSHVSYYSQISSLKGKCSQNCSSLFIRGPCRVSVINKGSKIL